MFQYVLALLLINTYYQSLGNPVPPGNHPMISSYLLGLKDCDNKFVSEQIQNSIPACNITAPPYEEQQLHCLMFYDINNQICSAIAASKLVPSEDSAAKINESQDINTFCASIKDFVFTNLTEFPFYKRLAEKLFNTSATCGKVCGYSDIANEDTKYYCKYFKWGIEMLKNHTTAPISDVGKDLHDPVSSDTSNVDIPVINSNAQNTNIKTGNGQLPVVPETHTHTAVDKLIQNIDQVGEASLPKPEVEQTPKETVQSGNNSGNVDPILDMYKDISSSTTTGMKQPDGKETKPKLVNSVPEIDTDKVEQKDTSANQKPDPEPEYTDGSEYEKGDGEVDENFGEKTNILENDKYTVIKKETVDISPKGYTRTENEDYPEEGDNFFPFFLTAVVLVVLLYILYHNKNKVTKVFFGLVLEGRQGGRRRNSRGHAYRRLDTLEQAMSAKAPMPPSKIIY